MRRLDLGGVGRLVGWWMGGAIVNYDVFGTRFLSFVFSDVFFERERRRGEGERKREREREREKDWGGKTVGQIFLFSSFHRFEKTLYSRISITP